MSQSRCTGIAAGLRVVPLLLLCIPGLFACTPTSRESQESAAPHLNESRDCANCPAMIELPAGSFLMGTAAADRLIDPRTGKPATNDGPQHRVTINSAFAMGKYEISTGEYGDFVAATGYAPAGPCMEFSPPETFNISTTTDWNDTGFPQTGKSPVGCVSFFDAQAYTNWLSSISGKHYRLPTEAEWEYAARAGTTTPYYWGHDAAQACSYANIRSQGAHTISDRQAESDINDGFPCDDGYAHSSPTGSYAANAFGLYDMQGNVWEWVADCNHKNYVGAPTDGSAWLEEMDDKNDKDCQFGVIRSGSFLNRVERSSTTVRAGRPREGRATNMGFRVVRAQVADNTTAPEQASAAWGATSKGATELGARVFNDNCAACHVNRDDYRGIYGKDQASLEKTIRDGGNNIMSMPAFSDRLTNEEITAVSTYVRQQNGW